MSEFTRALRRCLAALKAIGVPRTKVAVDAGISPGYLSQILDATGKRPKQPSSDVQRNLVVVVSRLAHEFRAQLTTAGVIDEFLESLEVLSGSLGSDPSPASKDGTSQTSILPLTPPGLPLAPEAANNIRRACDQTAESYGLAPVFLLITGPPQTGKSTLLWRMHKLARERGARVAFVDLQRRATPIGTADDSAQLSAALRTSLGDVGEVPSPNFEDRVHTWLAEDDNRHSVLIIDGVNLSRTLESALFRIAHHRYPHLTLVAATTSDIFIGTNSLSANHDNHGSSLAAFLNWGASLAGLAHAVVTSWFTRSEVDALFRAYGGGSELELERIWSLFRGQPLLTHRRIFLASISEPANLLLHRDEVELGHVRRIVDLVQAAGGDVLTSLASFSDDDTTTQPPTRAAEQLGLARRDKDGFRWSCNYYDQQLTPWVQAARSSGSHSSNGDHTALIDFRLPTRLLLVVDDRPERTQDFVSSSPAEVLVFPYEKARGLSWNIENAALWITAQIRHAEFLADVEIFLDLVAAFDCGDCDESGLERQMRDLEQEFSSDDLGDGGATIIRWGRGLRVVNAAILLCDRLAESHWAGHITVSVYSGNRDEFDKALRSQSKPSLAEMEKCWKARLEQRLGRDHVDILIVDAVNPVSEIIRVTQHTGGAHDQ